MLFELFPFTVSIRATTIAGLSLWSLALYVVFWPAVDWMMIQLVRWFNFAERSLYLNQKEFEETRSVRESINSLYASLVSITPFLLLGAVCDYWVETRFGHAWAVTAGLVACGCCGLHELGRRAIQPS